MPNSHFSSNAKIGLVLTGLILLGLLAACGDNTTATNQPAIGGQVPANTAASRPTNTPDLQSTVTPVYTVALLPTNTPAPNITIDTRPAVSTWDPNVPLPTPKPYPTGKPVESVPNFGTTENLYSKYSNTEGMQKFLDAYAHGQPGQWEYIVYGIDSGPFPHQFVYRGNGRQYTLLVDNTKDGFIAPEDRVIKEYSCQELTKMVIDNLDFGTCVAIPPSVPIPTPKPYPTGQPVTGVPNFGTTESYYGKFTNTDALQKFLDAYAQGQSGQWEYVVYGMESGPFPNRLVYRGNGRQFTLLVDNTKDTHAAPENQVIQEYTCEGLTKRESFLDYGTCTDSKGKKNLNWSLIIA